MHIIAAIAVVAYAVVLVTEGPVTARLALLAVVVVQQVEGDVLAPWVFGRALSLHPLVVVIALCGGAVLAGVARSRRIRPSCRCGIAVIRAAPRPSRKRKRK